MRYDVVYILKNNIQDDELIYSVRSVVKNFPYNRIWFYGGVPEHVIPDIQVDHLQTGMSKHERVTGTRKLICQNDDITEDFWLFNDDFFIMDKVEDMQPICAGSLLYHAETLKRKYRRITAHADILEKTMKILKRNKAEILDYELHIPMLINREKGLEVLERYPKEAAFRSMYGNMFCRYPKIMPDIKIQELDQEPDPDIHRTFISTSDASFRDGIVGEYIRSKFPEPCKYETLL